MLFADREGDLGERSADLDVSDPPDELILSTGATKSAPTFFDRARAATSATALPDRRLASLAIGIAQLVTYKLEAYVPVNQSQLVVFRNLIFDPKVIKERLRAGGLPHHKQPASENGNPAQHQATLVGL